MELNKTTNEKSFYSKLINLRDAEPASIEPNLFNLLEKTSTLGINTKSSAKLKTITDREIDIKYNEKTQTTTLIHDVEDKTFMAYARLQTAREILYSKETADLYKSSLIKTNSQIRQDLKDENKIIKSYKKGHTQHRTYHCRFDLSGIYTKKGEQATKKSEDNKGVCFYQNIETSNVWTTGQFKCGSVWTCPVCSRKITECRKLELQKAFKTFREMGGGQYKYDGNKVITLNKSLYTILMMTLTVPHYRKDNLQQLMLQIRDATKKFKEHRTYRETIKKYCFEGEIRALETTYSNANGWHPHFHSILFFKQEITAKEIKEIKSKLFKIWQQSAVKAGLQAPNLEHGLDLQDGSQAQNYINKWGIENELTKWTSKNGKKKSLSPFQLLDLYEKSETKENKLFYKNLFLEYSKAFKGFRQLYWSPKLKEKLGVLEVEDEELIEENETEKDIFLGSISQEEWIIIRKYKQIHKRTGSNLSIIYYLVKLVRNEGFKAVTDLIEHLNFIEKCKDQNIDIDHLIEEQEEELKSFGWIENN